MQSLSTSPGQMLIDLPSIFYYYTALTISDPWGEEFDSEEMVGCANCVKPCVSCRQHPNSSRLHHLDCNHIVETRYSEDCGKNCMKFTAALNSGPETGELLPPLPCTTCAEANIDWDKIDFKQVLVSDPESPTEYSEHFLLSRITGIKTQLVLRRAAFEAKVNGWRLCEMIFHPEDTMDWEEWFKGTNIGAGTFLQTKGLIPRPVQHLLPAFPKLELPKWFDQTGYIPMTEEPRITRGSTNSGKSTLHIWAPTAPRYAIAERMAEIIEQPDEGQANSPQALASRSTLRFKKKRKVHEIISRAGSRRTASLRHRASQGQLLDNPGNRAKKRRRLSNKHPKNEENTPSWAFPEGWTEVDATQEILPVPLRRPRAQRSDTFMNAVELDILPKSLTYTGRFPRTEALNREDVARGIGNTLVGPSARGIRREVYNRRASISAFPPSTGISSGFMGERAGADIDFPLTLETLVRRSLQMEWEPSYRTNRTHNVVPSHPGKRSLGGGQPLARPETPSGKKNILEKVWGFCKKIFRFFLNMFYRFGSFCARVTPINFPLGRI